MGDFIRYMIWIILFFGGIHYCTNFKPTNFKHLIGEISFIIWLIWTWNLLNK